MPATSHHMTREHEASPLGSCVLHFGKTVHFKHWLNEAECFLCVTHMAPAPVLLLVIYRKFWRLRRVISITKILEKCLWWVCFKVTSCSWLLFISVFVLLCRPKLDGRSLFSLAGEMFNKILGLVTEFRQIQVGKRWKFLLAKTWVVVSWDRRTEDGFHITKSTLIKIGCFFKSVF